MRILINFALVATSLLALGACARLDPVNINGQNRSTSVASPSSPAIVSQPSQDFAENKILSFLPASAVDRLTSKEKSEAASAQFFALQYGRVGAFREWSADSSTRGEVSVGPYIKVNDLDCREFTHTVILATERLSNTGTSCRETSGQWSVVSG